MLVALTGTATWLPGAALDTPATGGELPVRAPTEPAEGSRSRPPSAETGVAKPRSSNAVVVS
jgi:hypothetical protein